MSESPLADMKPQNIPINTGIEEVDDADQTIHGKIAETGQTEGHWTAPPVLGTPATNVDYGTRVWKENDHNRTPWSPPVVYAPLVRATRCDIDVQRTKSGNVKGVVVSLPQVEPEPTIPTSVLTAIKRMLAVAPEVVVTFARGYDIDATGEMKRKTIWQKNTPDENDPRMRIAVGQEDPAPVDSWLVRGVWMKDGRLLKVAGGWWTDGKPDFFQSWVWNGNGILLHKNLTEWNRWVDAQG